MNDTWQQFTELIVKFYSDGNWLMQVQTGFAVLFDWLKEWQFLLGTLIILLAATKTAKTLNREMRCQYLENEHVRRRLVLAYRASMPEDLDAIYSYTRRSSEITRQAIKIIDIKEDGGQSPYIELPKNKLRSPALPNYVLTNLRALVEHLDHANAESIAELLGCYYTQRARLTGALENVNHSGNNIIAISKVINFNPVLKSTLELYLRASSMVQFSRGQAERITGTFSAAEVLSALKVLDIDHAMSAEAREHCIQALSGAADAEQRATNRTA